MSTSSSATRGDDAARAGTTPGPHQAVDVKGVANRIARATHAKYPRLGRWLLPVVGFLLALCVGSALFRWAWQPLLPFPLFAVAVYAAWRLRRQQHDTPLLVWSLVFVGTSLVGFWLMSAVGNLLE